MLIWGNISTVYSESNPKWFQLISAWVSDSRELVLTIHLRAVFLKTRFMSFHWIKRVGTLDSRKTRLYWLVKNGIPSSRTIFHNPQYIVLFQAPLVLLLHDDSHDFVLLTNSRYLTKSIGQFSFCSVCVKTTNQQG